jgi:hypothetical protein
MSYLEEVHQAVVDCIDTYYEFGFNKAVEFEVESAERISEKYDTDLEDVADLITLQIAEHM